MFLASQPLSRKLFLAEGIEKFTYDGPAHSPASDAHVTITLLGAPRTSTAGDPTSDRTSDRTADPASAGSSGAHRSQPSRDPASTAPTAPTTPTGPTLESVVRGERAG